MANTYRILGIDPGLHITGYGVVDFRGSKAAVIEAGALRTPTRATLEQRVSLIHAELSKLLAEFKPDLVAVEQLYAHYKHPRTAILMGHARGIVLLACQQAGLAIEHLASTKVKKALPATAMRPRSKSSGPYKASANWRNCPPHPTWPTHWPSPFVPAGSD